MINKKLFGYFALIFAVVLLLGVFVLADSYDLVSSSQTASAGDTVSLLTFNVTLANTTAPAINNNLTALTIEILGTAGYTNITSVNVSDGTNDFSNNSLTSTTVTIDVTDAQIEAETNFTINFTLNSSADWNATFGANVTTLTGEGNVTTGFDAQFESSLVTIEESTAPTATASCSPSTVSVNNAFPCSCSGTDSGEAASGVDTETGTSTASGGISTPQNAGTYTYTCTVKDKAGNSATDTATYIVEARGPIPSGSGGGTSLPENVHSFSKITPGVVSIMKNFDSEIGLKEIQIEVINEVQNVKITVTKHDGKPAAVSVEKTGDVYQYLEIDADNLGNNLDKATITAKVEKSWVSSSGLSREDVAVSKFDEQANRWNELETSFNSEDATYYYYNAEVSEFSFFAIAEKTVTTDDGEEVGVSDGGAEERNLTWLWWTIVILVLVAVFFGWKAKDKK